MPPRRRSPRPPTLAALATGWLTFVCAAAAFQAVSAPVLASRQPATAASSQGTAPSRTPIGSFARATAMVLARRLLESGAFAEAEPILKRLLADSESAGDHEMAGLAEVALGRTANVLNNRDAAERWYAKATDRAAAHNLARTPAFLESVKGNDAWARGDQAEAVAHWRRSLPMFERLGAIEEQAATYRALAFAAPIGEATPLLERALALVRSEDNPRLYGLTVQALSDDAFVTGKWSKAFALVNEAMPILEQHGTALDQARVRVSLARLHRSHGDGQAALAEYRRAQSLLEGVDRGIGISTAWTTLGSGLSLLGHAEAALAAARRALDVAERSANNVDRTYAAFVGAEALLLLNRPADALALIDGGPSAGNGKRTLLVRRAYALSLLGRHDEALATARAADLLDGGGLEVIPANLATLAEVRRRAGDMSSALENAQEAVTVLERLRENAVPTDHLRVGFDDGFQWVHGRLVRLLAESGRQGDALAAAERARARAFIDLLASRDIAANPQMAATPSLDGIVAAARRLQTSIVAYWTDRDGILMWVVTPEGLAHQAAVPVSNERLAKLVARTWDSSEPLGESGRPSAYRELYDLLVGPIDATIRKVQSRRVTVVPHGPLFRLSFAGLQAPNGRHLIERVAVHYVPSVGALTALTSGERGSTPHAEGLIVSSPALDAALQREQHLAPLPGAVAEGRAVAGLLGLAPSRVLSHAAATERAVRAGLPGASIVHFATHAIVDDERPMDSFLALAGSAEGPAADGRLTVEEVYGLSLDAGLVVLSGCRTATGRVTGDGVAGLSRAFFASGTPSVVASLWDLPDVAGRVVLPGFYKAWSRLGDKAGALRDAQLALLRDLRAGRVSQDTLAGPIAVPAHPAVWAGLVLMGAP